MQAQEERPGTPPAVVLAAGILAVGTGSLFARLADAPALAIAFWRCAIATAAVVAVGPRARLRELRALPPRHLAWGALSGFWLAVHFATWIRSLELTSIAASVLLVNTSPVWVALLAPVLTRDRFERRTLAGIALAFAGSAILALGEGGGRPGALEGNALALCGGLAAALYLLAGRRLRAKASLGAYTTLAYGTAAALLLAAALPGEGVAGHPPETWGWLLACALVPQLVGHTSFNWALRWLPAAVVSVALLAEPLVATGLAWGFLGEVPGWPVVAGGAVTLAGIAWTVAGRRR